VILVCVFNFIQSSIHAHLFPVFDWQRSHIRQSIPFCHEVVQISSNLARGEQLFHKLKACRTGGL